MLRVRQDGKRERMLLREFLMGLCRILADAQDSRAFLCKLRPKIAVTAGLFCAAGGVVLGVKVENDLSAPLLLQSVEGPVLVRQGKIWCFGSDFQHSGLLSRKGSFFFIVPDD